MKKNTAISIKIPQGAEIIDRTSTDNDFAPAYSVMNTSAVLLVGSFNMLLPMTFFGGAVAFDMVSQNFGGTIMVLSGLSAIVTGFLQVLGWSETRDTSESIKELNEPIKASDNRNVDGYRFGFRSNSKGYKVSQTVRSNRFFTIYNPLRLFKRILINETVWYDPTTDVHTIERTYVNFKNVYTENEKFGGPRYSFRRALNSL